MIQSFHISWFVHKIAIKSNKRSNIMWDTLYIKDFNRWIQNFRIEELSFILCYLFWKKGVLISMNMNMWVPTYSNWIEQKISRSVDNSFRAYQLLIRDLQQFFRAYQLLIRDLQQFQGLSAAHRRSTTVLGLINCS